MWVSHAVFVFAGPPLLCDVLAAIGRMHGGYKSADPDGNCQMNSTSILERYDELGFPAAAQRRSITLQGNASQHRQVMASVLSHNGALKAMLRKDAFGVLKHCPGLKTEYDRLLRRRRLTDKLLSDDMKQELVVEAFEKAIAGMIVKGEGGGEGEDFSNSVEQHLHCVLVVTSEVHLCL